MATATAGLQYRVTRKRPSQRPLPPLLSLLRLQRFLLLRLPLTRARLQLPQQQRQMQ